MKSKLTKALLGILAVLLIVLVFPTGLETVVVRHKLNQAIASLEGALQFSDGHARFLYDDVSVSGIGLGKTVHIVAPRIEWEQEDKKFILKFSTIKAGLASSSPYHWKVAVSGPLTLMHNLRNEAEMSLDTDAVLELHLEGFGSPEMDAQLSLPKQLIITPVVKPESKAAIVFEENPLFAMKTSPTGELVYARLASKKAIAQGPIAENRYVFDELSAIYQVGTDSSGDTKRDIDVVLKNLEVPEYIHPYGPAYVIARASVKGNMPFSSAALLQLMTNKADLDVKELSLNFRDFGVNLKGSAKTVTAEWPVGDFTLVVRNAILLVNEISRQFQFSSEKRTFMNALIGRMAGQPVSDIQDMNIPIERTTGAELTISAIPLSQFVKAIETNDISQIKDKK